MEYGKNSQISVWDITIKREAIELDELRGILKQLCKAWCFQVEEGKTTGYVHWQCRVSLRERCRYGAMIKTSLGSLGNCSHTSKAGALKVNFYNYCTKDYTRVEGPWSDKDEVKVSTRQLKIFEQFSLYPWQKKVVDMSANFCMRSIDVVYDTEGNLGKSIFGEWMEYCGMAEEIPPFRLMDDIFQWVFGRPKHSAYFVDMPRGMKKDKLADFYSGLEIIKNGVAYDKRYTARKVRFDRPRIFVFTNELPNFGLMSKDRWNVWCVKNRDLVKYEEEIVEGICNTDLAL